MWATVIGCYEPVSNEQYEILTNLLTNFPELQPRILAEASNEKTGLVVTNIALETVTFEEETPNNQHVAERLVSFYSTRVKIFDDWTAEAGRVDHDLKQLITALVTAELPNSKKTGEMLCQIRRSSDL